MVALDVMHNALYHCCGNFLMANGKQLKITEKLKSDADKIREDELLTELVSVVHERSQLVDKMDDERIR
ncbi:hypothetical protein EB796_007099 [Bugula neritina]|uniref:BMERB domain-containing protein n=1 Tax=Bugula neritina TaxID=10212 RepID=A0A7J7KAF9_BUGNE|nr:hypothetical protein EB796_019714 [Bugula neritina]KAF6034598.1 hypothetical protein EB796_007099 [Bugula neritina]